MTTIKHFDTVTLTIMGKSVYLGSGVFVLKSESFDFECLQIPCPDPIYFYNT